MFFLTYKPPFFGRGVFQPAIFDDTRLEVGLHHEFWGLFDMDRGDGSVSKRTTIGYYTHIYISYIIIHVSIMVKLANHHV